MRKAVLALAAACVAVGPGATGAHASISPNTGTIQVQGSDVRTATAGDVVEASCSAETAMGEVQMNSCQLIDQVTGVVRPVPVVTGSLGAAVALGTFTGLPTAAYEICGTASFNVLVPMGSFLALLGWSTQVSSCSPVATNGTLGPALVVVGTFSPPVGTTPSSSGAVDVAYQCTAVAQPADAEGSPVVTTTISSCDLTPVNADAVGAAQPPTVGIGPVLVAAGLASNITQLGFDVCWTASVEYRDTSTATTSGCATPMNLGPLTGAPIVIPAGGGESST